MKAQTKLMKDLRKSIENVLPIDEKEYLLLYWNEGRFFSNKEAESIGNFDNPFLVIHQITIFLDSLIESGMVSKKATIYLTHVNFYIKLRA